MHKVTDAITGQKHPQDSQVYPQMYGNNQGAIPYPSEGEIVIRVIQPVQE
jgi:hypothetical protein